MKFLTKRTDEMKTKYSIITGVVAVLLSSNVLASQCAGVQCVEINNFLKGKTAIKIDVYDAGKKCYTHERLAFGKKINLTVEQNDAQCKSINKLVITPLKAHGTAFTVPISGDATINLRQQTASNDTQIVQS